MCNCEHHPPSDTNCKNASRSNHDDEYGNDQLPPSPHPPALGEMKPGSIAYPITPLSHTPRIDVGTAEMSDHIPPRAEPLPPASTYPRSSQNTPLQIASSEFPVAPLSASSVTSMGNHSNPDSLCATKPDISCARDIKNCI